MKKLIQTLKNIWSIEELRSKILFTLLLILIYRIGAHIVLPGIDPAGLDLNAGQGGMLGMIDMFAGGAFSQASIFALGIMPYISASIFMQLMTVLVPQFQKMQKEGDSGRKKINQWTRYLTVLVTIVQASAYVAYLRQMTQQGGMIESFRKRYFTDYHDRYHCPCATNFCSGVCCQINPHRYDPGFHYRNCHSYFYSNGLYHVDTGCSENSGELCQADSW